jgi:hypothetical protein
MTQTSPIFEKLKTRLPQAVVRQDEPLAKRTTLRVGGCAEVYVEPSSEEDLAAQSNFATRRVPLMLLGRGSNLLIRDGGIRGVVICLAHPAFSSIEVRIAICVAARGPGSKPWPPRPANRAWAAWNFWRAFRAASAAPCA